MFFSNDSISIEDIKESQSEVKTLTDFYFLLKYINKIKFVPH